MKRLFFFFFIIPALSALFLSCGIDEYAFIYPVLQGDVDTTALPTATVSINNDNSGTVFTNFIILYRIYISDVSVANPQTGDFSLINPALNSHYASISGYIDNDTLFSAGLLQSLFINKGYKYLCFEGSEMENILTSAVLARTLFFDFTYSNRPATMAVMNGNVNLGTYTLLRSDELDQPRPEDTLNFVNSAELLNPDYAIPEINADVEKNSKTSKGPDLYSYAAMFILAVGIETTGYTMIYSTPTFIHAFPLPERY